MKFQTLGGKRQFVSVTVRNADTITIPKGSPCFYKPDTTGTVGLDVVSDTSLATARQGFFAGIALEDIAVGRYGDAHSDGICLSVNVIIATRSATSAVWASYPAGTYGDLLGFSTAAVAQGLSDIGAGSALSVAWFAQLATTYASLTTNASTNGVATALVSTALLPAMIRAM